MAKGKLRNTDASNNKISPSANGGLKGSEMYTTEFEINETPPTARTLLTKGFIQDEINGFSGATVSTRGRFMTESEKQRCTNERPLYLYIQGHTKRNIDMAIQKINEIIKTEHRSSLNRPSRFTNAPPPLMSLHSGVPSVEKICVGIENAPEGFGLRGRIIGAGGSNLLYIRGETGATVTLRGRGSQFIDPALGTESPEPLHLYIEHPNPPVLQNAKQLAINLIQTMQSELQSYIQQQPPPVQSQQVIPQPQIQQIQQAQFQTMNIGAVGQPNVVTIQHQDIIQHPQNSVVTLPATILTATVAGTPGPGMHSGPMQPTDHAQHELQTFVPPPSVSQVQLIGPPPTISQVQYQIHPGQPLQIQGLPPCSESPAQPVTQMYVMSQPPPHHSPIHQGFVSASSGPSAAVSYVYTQPSLQRSSTPSRVIETVNLQQPPPPPPPPANHHHHPPPSLLHLHFPPPFPPNQPPPPIPQTYQIQYQQVPAVSQAQTQFLLQTGGEPDQNHIQFEGQEVASSSAPQPVPPPRMVPPPPANMLTSVPPPTHAPPPPQAPWLYQGQQIPVAPSQPQLQMQIPAPNLPPPEVQAQMHYHAQQVQYHNGQIQTQVHYALQPPHHMDSKPELSDQHKLQGMKRRFSDLEGVEESPIHPGMRPPSQRHGMGEEDRHRAALRAPAAAALGPSSHDRVKPHMPPTHPGDKRNGDQSVGAITSGQESVSNLDPGSSSSHGPISLPLPVPQGPWPGHFARIPYARPPAPREEHHPHYRAPPPVNLPPPRLRMIRGPSDDSQAVCQIGIGDQRIEYEALQSYSGKAHPSNPLPLMHSICDPPPPPPPPPPATPSAQMRPQHHLMQSAHHFQQPPVSHALQPPAGCPPWMN
ncbi:KH homology domain-containing protein 4-like isoform X2 [Leptopilina heterotoma]|uniref:KH homology domain-containing protein 4-like isoform X2 n=1 Tax=Leptopilina heterotoma TaxID=63436 RepID=UPI001CA9E54C|nr:KH homology domain-containing protein 4-like isoform X2 [Leptopilina heterotoma]